ncbi:uncharacterized protein PHACADRAFT_249651 [Phanerochaete carnosa HHB-10118-sp]|uniref:RING-type domain-containing protein n=1 Tax=Phanerochaete carnosa (strain HHB-10118-sp) TaxID=650164 RepID=K5WJG0_PHACS|nr:uncharacterized protein PHACADRAFT_249651 [Phanerochaete carnosa HHB-10118-sp]EKM59269.1 hypothetical protein PHACADRAFT_249651 [Phanerochaete carnosa HHB-10118-sp]
MTDFVQGMGIVVRDETHQDIEGEIDIDGEDEALYGAAQFTEDDVLGSRPLSAGEDEDVQVDDEDSSQSLGASGPAQDASTAAALRHVIEGKLVKKAALAGEAEDVKKSLDEVMGIGETEQAECAIELAKKSGDAGALMAALENKVKLLVSFLSSFGISSFSYSRLQESIRVASSTSPLCRICIDPYTEPTVSTGCWHTCCRECWLRCLGSTKLCPICKRITAPADLRRVYL